MVQTREMLKHHRWSIISERKKEKKICSSFRQWRWQSLYPITALLKRKRYSCILKSFGSSTTNWAHHAICFFFYIFHLWWLKKKLNYDHQSKANKAQLRPAQTHTEHVCMEAAVSLFNHRVNISVFIYFLFFFVILTFNLHLSWITERPGTGFKPFFFSISSMQK